MRRLRLILVLALLVGGALLAVVGHSDARVNLSSILALWSDAARDADQAGMKLTRLSDADEMRIGAELTRNSLWTSEDAADSAYVTDIAQLLLPHVRRHGIRYTFRVVESPAINAFALPGGHVFVTTALLDFAESEAEVAAVLGHEISHVDLRHCVERYQYEYRLRKAGMPQAGFLVEFAHRLATIGFAPYQETEADLNGERLAIDAGYDPDAAASLFQRMKTQFGEPAVRPATTPAGEVGHAVGQAIGSYFSTHPPSSERAQQLSEMVAQNRRELKGRPFYVGRQNLKERVARARRQYQSENREW